MIHDKAMINSLEPFVAKHLSENKGHDELFNEWIGENGLDIHDADTAMYFIALIPMIERRLKGC